MSEHAAKYHKRCCQVARHESGPIGALLNVRMWPRAEMNAYGRGGGFLGNTRRRGGRGRPSMAATPRSRQLSEQVPPRRSENLAALNDPQRKSHLPIRFMRHLHYRRTTATIPPMTISAWRFALALALRFGLFFRGPALPPPIRRQMCKPTPSRPADGDNIPSRRIRATISTRLAGPNQSLVRHRGALFDLTSS
jgi:hypothetical protein